MKYRKIIILVVLLLIFWKIDIAFSDVAVKIVIANPSASEEKVMPVRYDLPKGIARIDILDPGGLNVEYDVNSGVYYVHKEFKLGPKETKTIKILLRDMWKVPEDQVNDLRNILKERVSSIGDPEKQDVAKLIAKSIEDRLVSILKVQTELTGNIKQRMQMYSVHTQKMKSIKEEIFSLDSLVRLGKPLSGPEGEVTLVIEAANVLNKEIEIPLKYYLPKEIIPEYVVNKGIFDVNHDVNKGQFYLTAKQAFGPLETKRFKIVIKNVWRIPEELVKGYMEEANEVNEKLADTDMAAVAQSLFNDIGRKADKIVESQNRAEGVREYIAIYRDNKDNLEIIKDNLDKLKSLASKIVAKQMIARRKVKITNVLREMEYLSSIKKVSDNVLQKLKTVAVWKVIMTIVIFIIGLTVFFYSVWFINIKKEEARRFEQVGAEK